MRRIIALICAAAALPAIAAAGGAAQGVPAPAASPPLGDDYFTPWEMRRGLPAAADLPAGYTVVGDTLDMGFTDSSLCHFMPSDPPENTRIVARTFTRRGGGRLTIDIIASGATAARANVASVAAVPQACPTATDGDETRRNTRLPLPSLGDAAAGVISVTDSPGRPGQRSFSAVVALGDVYVAFVATGGDQAGFVEFVKAGTRTAHKVAAPLSATDLQRALLAAADLPAGYRRAAAAENTRDFFTERRCDGKLVDYGTPATFLHRTFTKSGGPTIRVAVGTAEKAGALVGAVSARRVTCGTGPELRLPPTDLTTGAGIVYPGRPVRARAIFVFRGVFTEIVATAPDRTALPAIERIVQGAWLGKLFKVYYPNGPE